MAGSGICHTLWQQPVNTIAIFDDDAPFDLCYMIDIFRKVGSAHQKIQNIAPVKTPKSLSSM